LVLVATIKATSQFVFELAPHRQPMDGLRFTWAQSKAEQRQKEEEEALFVGRQFV